MAKLISDETLDELEESEAPKVSSRKLSDAEIENEYSNLSFRVIYQSNNYFLPQIRDLINKREVINIRPEYQRRLRWSNKKKSLLIESLLLNIPVPPIFLYESDLARYEVMDGQQRLNSVHEFLENQFALTGLEKLTFLNRKRYGALPPTLKRGLERASVSAIILLRETKAEEADPYLVRRYVFERLNTGGEALNAQEIRNSLFRGPFNDLIVELARDNTFCNLFGIPEYADVDENEYYENPARQKNNLYRTMGDCQLVLRFFALAQDQHIRGSMQRILDECMSRNSRASADVLTRKKDKFVDVIGACNEIFDGEAFLLPEDEKGNRRISVALYDAITVAMQRRIEKLPRFVEKRKRLRTAIDHILEDREQLAVLTGKANTAQSVKDRIAAIGNILDGI